MFLFILLSQHANAVETPDSLKRLLHGGSHNPQIPFQQSAYTALEATKRYPPQTTKDKVERRILEITRETEEFGRYANLFDAIDLNNADLFNNAHEKDVASGVITNALNERYKILIQDLQTRGESEYALILPVLSEYYEDLKVHVREVAELIPRLARQSGGVNIPESIPHGGIYGGPPIPETPPSAENLGFGGYHKQAWSNTYDRDRASESSSYQQRQADSRMGARASTSATSSVGGGGGPTGRAPEGARPGVGADVFAGSPNGSPGGSKKMANQAQYEALFQKTGAHARGKKPDVMQFNDEEVAKGIQFEMERFESIKPLFQRVTPEVGARYTGEDLKILTGEPTQKLHERFLALQKQQSPDLAQQYRLYLRDLRTHVDDVERVLTSAVGNGATVAGGSLAGGGDVNSSNAGTNMGGAEFDAAIKEIQEYMQKFEAIAPLFAHVPSPESLRGQVSPHEMAVLAGEVSQRLHERFTTLQKMGADDPQYVDKMLGFSHDLKVHVEEATNLLDRYAKGGAGAGTQFSAPSSASCDDQASRSRHFSGAAGGIVGPPIDISSHDEGSNAGAMHSGSTHAPPRTPDALPQRPRGAVYSKETVTMPTAGEHSEISKRIQVQMKRFESIAPMFEHLISAEEMKELDLLPEEMEVASGVASQRLHERFLEFTKNEMTIEMLPILRQYAEDLEAHVQLASNLIPELTRENYKPRHTTRLASGGAELPPVGRSSGGNVVIPGRPVGTGDVSAARPVGDRAEVIPGRPVGTGGSTRNIPVGSPVGNRTQGIPGRPVGTGASSPSGGITGRPVGTSAGGLFGNPVGTGAGGSPPWGGGTRPANASSQGSSFTPGGGSVLSDSISEDEGSSLPRGIISGIPFGMPGQGAGRGGGGGGGGPKQSLDDMFKDIEQMMKQFEEIKPMFQRLPPPNELRGKVSSADFELLSGQASERLHHRFLAIQAKLSNNNYPQSQQMVYGDVEIFLADLREHIPAMKKVLAVDYSPIIAAAPSAGSSRNGSPQMSRTNILSEIPQILAELKKTRKRFKKTLDATKEYMSNNVSSDSPEVEKEMNRLVHMMGSIYNGIQAISSRLVKELKASSTELTDEQIEQVKDMMLEVQRYKDTVRDLEGDAAKKDGGQAPSDLEMLRPQGILTRKPVNLSQATIPRNVHEASRVQIT